MTVEEIKSKDDFENTKKFAGLVVVDFTASWCGPCQQIKPYFHELATQYEDVKFVSIDVDDNGELAEELGVQAMPTFMFFKGGEKQDEFKGANKEKLLSNIAKYK